MRSAATKNLFEVSGTKGKVLAPPGLLPPIPERFPEMAQRAPFACARNDALEGPGMPIL